jgi:hypothetical protein
MIRAWKNGGAVIKAATIYLLTIVVLATISIVWSVHALVYVEFAIVPTYLAFRWGHMIGFEAGIKTGRKIKKEVDDAFNQIVKGP